MASLASFATSAHEVSEMRRRFRAWAGGALSAADGRCSFLPAAYLSSAAPRESALCPLNVQQRRKSRHSATAALGPRRPQKTLMSSPARKITKPTAAMPRQTRARNE